MDELPGCVELTYPISLKTLITGPFNYGEQNSCLKILIGNVGKIMGHGGGPLAFQ